MKSVRIIRVDPYRRTIAAIQLRAVRDATPHIRRILRTNNIGSREILKVEDQPLMVVGGLDVDEAMQGWRLRGTDDTAGISIITGRDVNKGLVIDAPVTVQWVKDRIQWLDGEDVGARDERAAEILPSLNADVRLALTEAVPTPDGDMWLTAAHRDIVGDAMQTLGLGTDRSRGQMLTKLGEAVSDLLLAEAA